MAGLDTIPQKQTVEIEIAKLDESLLESINDLNKKINLLINDFGSIYIRKKELNEEITRLDDILERAEDEFKVTNSQLKEIIDGLDDTYPQGRVNIQEGTIQYQPGAPTRKQLAEQQQQAANSSKMKVVKE